MSGGFSKQGLIRCWVRITVLQSRVGRPQRKGFKESSGWTRKPFAWAAGPWKNQVMLMKRGEDAESHGQVVWYRLVLSALSVKINTLFYFVLAKEPLKNVILKSEFSLCQLRNEDHWKFEAFSFFELFWTSGPVWGKGLFQDLHHFLTSFILWPDNKSDKDRETSRFSPRILFLFSSLDTEEGFLIFRKRDKVSSMKWDQSSNWCKFCLSIPALSSPAESPQGEGSVPWEGIRFCIPTHWPWQ